MGETGVGQRRPSGSRTTNRPKKSPQNRLPPNHRAIGQGDSESAWVPNQRWFRKTALVPKTASAPNQHCEMNPEEDRLEPFGTPLQNCRGSQDAAGQWGVGQSRVGQSRVGQCSETVRAACQWWSRVTAAKDGCRAPLGVAAADQSIVVPTTNASDAVLGSCRSRSSRREDRQSAKRAPKRRFWRQSPDGFKVRIQSVIYAGASRLQPACSN
jgi:hypothetical protein